MNSLDDIKQQLLEAEKAASKPQSVFHDTARKVVNIERQSFYGDESRMKRLAKIRETVIEGLKQGEENEVQEG